MASITKTSDSPRVGREVGFRADIQGLRAVAVLAVIFFHMDIGFVRGGFTGVDIFFVISGYVIAHVLWKEVSRTASLNVVAFAWRRFARLGPALGAVVTFTLLVSVLVLPPLGPQTVAAWTGLASMLIFANGVIATNSSYFAFESATNPLLHTWSLSVEEQFYVGLPILVALLLKVFGRRGNDRRMIKALIIALSLLGLASFTLAMLHPSGITLPTGDVLIGFYSPVVRIWEFLAGFLAFFLSETLGEPTRKLSTLLMIAGACMVTFSFFVIDSTFHFPGPWAGVPVLGVSLLLLLRRRETLVSRFLGWSPLVWIGDRSYSLYLWHWPFVVYSSYLFDSKWGPVIGSLVSIIPAFISFRLLEVPFRQRLNHLHLPARPGAMFRVMIIPVLVSLAVVVGGSSAWGHQPTLDFREAISAKNFAQLNGCDNGLPMPMTPANCSVQSRGQGPPIYLVGDSNAGHFSSGIVAAGIELGSPTTVSVANGCPFLDILIDDSRPAAKSFSCSKYNSSNLDALLHAEAGIVVIANSDIYWVKDFHVVDPGRNGDGERSDGVSKVSDKLGEFRKATERTASMLADSGHQVVFFHTIPKWGDKFLWDPSTCTAFEVFEGSCAAEQPLDAFISESAESRDALEQGASRGGASVWDPAEALCDANICSTHSPSGPRYRDRGHLSELQSLELTTPLVDMLSSMTFSR